MNLLIAPLLVISLIVSASPEAGQCVEEIGAAYTCANCTVKAGTVNALSAPDRLNHQARKHVGYYLTLVRAQQDLNKPAEARQYSARNDLSLTPTRDAGH